MRKFILAAALLLCSSLAHATVTECDDGVDNDGDGYIDLQDPGCGNNPNGVTELPFNPPGLDLSGTATDLGSTDMFPGQPNDDGGTGFTPPADAGHFGGVGPSPTAPGTTAPLVHATGCDYLAGDRAPLGGLVLVFGVVAGALWMSRRPGA